ncbi:hypothetical protein WA026_006292 [Henosepilachna vigintioctopunctata]|uniref:Uncharacterized protein n=1 Tax=Henosepilachna vigintioctopunctata TaxID=420089 RepID=A0AAW1TST0_9CUCU
MVFRFVFMLISAFVLVNGLSTEIKEKFMERMEKIGGECAAEVGANEDDISELIAHKYPSRHEGECMIFCFYKSFGMMHEDGSLHEEGALKMIEPLKADDPDLYEKVVAIGKHCAKEVSALDDKCKYSAKLAQCAVLKGKEMGLDSSIFE